MDILGKNLVGCKIKTNNPNENFGVFGDNDFNSYDYENFPSRIKIEKYYKVEVILSNNKGLIFKMRKKFNIIYINYLVFCILDI